MKDTLYITLPEGVMRQTAINFFRPHMFLMWKIICPKGTRKEWEKSVKQFNKKVKKHNKKFPNYHIEVMSL